ncbi:MAG: signal peptidase II [Thermoanaerobaculales bacterium]
MRRAYAIAVAAAVVAADQLTKLWIVATYPFGTEVDVVPGVFRLVHTRNRGIAFGMFGGAGPAMQSVLLAAVAVIVGFVAWQLTRTGKDGLAPLGLSLVLGGAIGNIIDRIARGEVVDFLLFFVTVGGREHSWPAFNVADSAISVGAGCVILAEVLAQRRSKRAPSPD